jgi:hypothetical protein
MEIFNNFINKIDTPLDYFLIALCLFILIWTFKKDKKTKQKENSEVPSSEEIEPEIKETQNEEWYIYEKKENTEIDLENWNKFLEELDKKEIKPSLTPEEQNENKKLEKKLNQLEETLKKLYRIKASQKWDNPNEKQKVRLSLCSFICNFFKCPCGYANDYEMKLGLENDNKQPPKELKETANLCKMVDKYLIELNDMGVNTDKIHEEILNHFQCCEMEKLEDLSTLTMTENKKESVSIPNIEPEKKEKDSILKPKKLDFEPKKLD